MSGVSTCQDNGFCFVFCFVFLCAICLIFCSPALFFSSFFHVHFVCCFFTCAFFFFFHMRFVCLLSLHVRFFSIFFSRALCLFVVSSRVCVFLFVCFFHARFVCLLFVVYSPALACSSQVLSRFSSRLTE